MLDKRGTRLRGGDELQQSPLVISSRSTDPQARTPPFQVLVSARENYDLELPPAVVALLKVHDRAVLGGIDDEDQQGRPPPPIPEMATAKLLIPQVQAGTLIGKGGNTIKSMQEQTRASIKVLQESEFIGSEWVKHFWVMLVAWLGT